MKASSVPAWDPMESLVDKRLGPGILMMTSSMQMLYRDRRSWELCAQINRNHNSKSATGILPPAVADLGAEVMQALKEAVRSKDQEHIRIKRLIGDLNHPVLLCGLGLPDRNGHEDSRILIIMEEIGRRQNTAAEHAKEMFRLTEREVAVVQNLLKGWTNKEIANALGVTEQTVKEHIKHIMEKTKTTTRTGVLVQIARLSVERPSNETGSEVPPPVARRRHSRSSGHSSRKMLPK
jgi:DNA-binding CsgD family transcriptional regulator